jgi:hypothetical protein
MLYSPSLRLKSWRDHGADTDVFYRVRRDVRCCLVSRAGVLWPTAMARFVA